MNSPLKNLSKPGVSVVIITHNGENRLLPTLEHLACQENLTFSWEILIIDNNSNDNTKHILQRFRDEKKDKLNVRIVNEEKQGQAFARNRGIQEAAYQYILFCDDDNWLDKNYVEVAYSIICSDERIAAVGGEGFMEYEPGFTPPNWIKPYERNYGTGPQGAEDGDTTNSKGCLYTAGTILDRQWLDKLYRFGFVPSLKGRDGKSLIGGEDTEITYALKLIGGKLYYSSKMRFKHYMPKNRINWQYLRKLWRSFGYSDYILSPYTDYFLSKPPKVFLKYFLNRLRDLRFLYFQEFKKGFPEGSKETLTRERIMGELRAMIFANNKYRQTKEMIVNLESQSKS
jgi:glycosyltransferase involved in cell wall biosynthesis